MPKNIFVLIFIQFSTKRNHHLSWKHRPFISLRFRTFLLETVHCVMFKYVLLSVCVCLDAADNARLITELNVWLTELGQSQSPSWPKARRSSWRCSAKQAWANQVNFSVCYQFRYLNVPVHYFITLLRNILDMFRSKYNLRRSCFR